MSSCVDPASDRAPFGSATTLIPAVEFVGDTRNLTLQAQLARHRVPGVSYATIESGGIVKLGSVGSADESSGRSLRSDMALQAASISKAVTAIGFMVLVDAGAVDLDADVETYLTTWAIPSSQFKALTPTTGRALLSHSAGASVPSYPGFELNSDLPDLDAILTGAEKSYSDPVTIDSAPGSYRYSGGGYMILQKTIEDVSGLPFEQFMQEKVFGPVGMQNSTFAIRQGEAGAAFGHDWSGQRRSDPWQDYPQSAPAGLWTTPEDLAKLMIEFGRSYRGEAEGLLSRNAAQEMTKVVIDETGLGFGVHGSGADLKVSHAGWSHGYRSYMIFFPETGEGFVAIANADAGHNLIDDLVRTVAATRNWAGMFDRNIKEQASWQSDRLEAVTGTFIMSPAGFPVQISAQDGLLTLATPRGSVYSLTPTAEFELTIEQTGGIVRIDPESGDISLWGMVGSKKNRN